MQRYNNFNNHHSNRKYNLILEGLIDFKYE